MTENNTLYLNFFPLKWQENIIFDDRRWKVIVAHRRAGKTHLALAHLFIKALETNNANYAYIAPTYKQAKTIAWKIIKEMWKDLIAKINESELRITLLNNSEIRLYWSDNPDSLRGIALWWVVYDEYSQQPSYIHTEIIRPALSDHQGFGIWIWTPKGKNSFYRIYEHAKANTWSWLPVMLKASESNLLKQEELDDAKRIMSPEEYDQEYECSFDIAIQWAYYAEAMRRCEMKGQIRKSVYSSLLPVYTFWDIGVHDYTSIIVAQFDKDKINIIDYMQDHNKGSSYYTSELLARAEKYGWRYAYHYLPHDAKVKEWGWWVKREDLVREALTNVRIADNIPIKDWIEAVRFLLDITHFELETTDDLRACLMWYHEEFDDRKGMFKNWPAHDTYSHGADAMRYLAVTYKKIINIQTADYSPVIAEY